MSQHDQVIANDTGANVRTDINAALAAAFGLSSGTSAPSTTIAYMPWADTTTGLLKIRNAANSAWVTVGTLADTNLGLLALAGGTMTGALILADQLLTRAYIKDYALTEAANATATGSVGVDLENGNEHHLTLTGAISSLTISNWPSTGRRGRLTLYLKQGGSGSYTVSWPAAVDWGTAGAPTLSTTVGHTDVVVLTTNDAGTNIFAMLAGKGFT